MRRCAAVTAAEWPTGGEAGRTGRLTAAILREAVSIFASIRVICPRANRQSCCGLDVAPAGERAGVERATKRRACAAGLKRGDLDVQVTQQLFAAELTARALKHDATLIDDQVAISNALSKCQILFDHNHGHTLPLLVGDQRLHVQNVFPLNTLGGLIEQKNRLVFGQTADE